MIAMPVPSRPTSSAAAVHPCLRHHFVHCWRAFKFPGFRTTSPLMLVSKRLRSSVSVSTCRLLAAVQSTVAVGQGDRAARKSAPGLAEGKPPMVAAPVESAKPPPRRAVYRGDEWQAPTPQLSSGDRVRWRSPCHRCCPRLRHHPDLALGHDCPRSLGLLACPESARVSGASPLPPPQTLIFLLSCPALLQITAGARHGSNSAPPKRAQ